jgi:hypothetical protein
MKLLNTVVEFGIRVGFKVAMLALGVWLGVKIARLLF